MCDVCILHFLVSYSVNVGEFCVYRDTVADSLPRDNEQFQINLAEMH